MNNELTKTLLAIGIAIICAGCEQSPLDQLKQMIKENKAEIQAEKDAHAATLLAGSTYVNVSNNNVGGPETAIYDSKITVLVLVPQEVRVLHNGTADPELLEKSWAVALADNNGYVAFTFEGKNQNYATLPANIAK